MKVIGNSYVHVDAFHWEHLDRRVVTLNVAIKLLASFVPLDGVEGVPVHVVEAGQLGGLARKSQRGHGHFPELQRFSCLHT